MSVCRQLMSFERVKQCPSQCLDRPGLARFPVDNACVQNIIYHAVYCYGGRNLGAWSWISDLAAHDGFNSAYSGPGIKAPAEIRSTGHKNDQISTM
jgi:hypothetical protein